MIAALGLDQLTGMGVLVDLDHAGAPLLGRCGTKPAWVGVEDRDDVAQALIIGLHQALEFFLELDFFFESRIVLQGLQLGELRFKGLFCGTKFGEFGQDVYLHELYSAAIYLKQKDKPMLQRLSSRVCTWVWQCEKLLISLRASYQFTADMKKCSSYQAKSK